MARIIHINSSGCDITDHEMAEVGDNETPHAALIRYIEEIGPDCIEENDTFRIFAN